MAEGNSAPSTWELASRLIGQISGLAQTELRLVRAEIGEKANAVVQAAALLAGGVVLALGGFFILLEACVQALVARGFPPHWAGLIVAALAVAIAGLLLFRAMRVLKPANLAPSRSLAQLHKNFNWLKGDTE